MYQGPLMSRNTLILAFLAILKPFQAIIFLYMSIGFGLQWAIVISVFILRIQF